MTDNPPSSASSYYTGGMVLHMVLYELRSYVRLRFVNDLNPGNLQAYHVLHVVQLAACGDGSALTAPVSAPTGV